MSTEVTIQSKRGSLTVCWGLDGRLSSVLLGLCHDLEDEAERVDGEPPHYSGKRLISDLVEYLSGVAVNPSVDVTTQDAGTPFQRSVWKATQLIPYGETRSYGWVAKAIGRSNASRAVGGALARNPLHLLVPCHRVLSSTGDLTGFAAGKEWKAVLLEMERTRTPNKSRTG